jgi:ribosomal protein L35
VNNAKTKNSQGAAKRFRLTATGKINAGIRMRVTFDEEDKKAKATVDIDALVSDSDHDRVMSMLPYRRTKVRRTSVCVVVRSGT